MAANLQLSELEQRVLDRIKHRVVEPTADDLRFDFRHTSYSEAEINQALSNLINQSLISADENLRFHAVGKEI